MWEHCGNFEQFHGGGVEWRWYCSLAPADPTCCFGGFCGNMVCSRYRPQARKEHCLLWQVGCMTGRLPLWLPQDCVPAITDRGAKTGGRAFEGHGCCYGGGVIVGAVGISAAIWYFCCSSSWVHGSIVLLHFLKVRDRSVTCFGQWNRSRSDGKVGALRAFPCSVFLSQINPRSIYWGLAIISKWLVSALESKPDPQ